MAGKFELYKDKAGEFRFRLKAGNGEIILASEGYKQKASAMNGIESVRKNAAVEARFEKKTTKAGKVTLKTTGKAKKLYVKLSMKAPATAGFEAYSYTKKWTVK